MSPDYPFYLVKMVTETLSHCFAIRWGLLIDYTPGFTILASNLTTQSPLLLVPEWPFRKYCHSQRHKLGAFVPLMMSFLPGYLQPQWLPGGIACVRMIPVVWALLALARQPILVLAFDSISNHGCSFHTVCIRCSFSINP